jgi:hypothetical protein
MYRWQAHIEPFRSLYLDQEHSIGIGLITTGFVLVGLYCARRRDEFRIAIAVAVILIVFVTVWAPGFCLWPIFSPLIPSAGAIRAVGRVELLLLVPASMGLASILDVLGKRRVWLAAAVLAVCICEQVNSTPSYDKLVVREQVASLAAAIPKNCAAFLYTPRRTVLLSPGKLGGRNIKSQIDGMWAQFYTGIPTVNGYSGYPPPHWPFFDITIYSEADRARLSEHLADWARAQSMNSEPSCRVEITPNEAPNQSTFADYLSERSSFARTLLQRLKWF